MIRFTAPAALSLLLAFIPFAPGSAAQGVTIPVTTPITLTNSITIPSHATLRFWRGGVVHLDPDVVLTIEGGVEAGPWQIFQCSAGARVVIEPGHVSRVYPQWWGDNIADSVQQALTAAAHCGCELYLPAGRYVFDKTVRYRFTDTGFAARGLTIRGAGPGRTVIDNRSAGQASFFFGTGTVSSQTGWFLSIHGLELTSSTGRGASGVEIEDVWMGRIANCLVSNHAGDGIRMRADLNDFGLPKTWIIEQSLIVKNGRYGIHLESVNNEVAYNVTMDRLDVELNKKGGIYAAAELTKITNSIIAYNGTDAASHGGIYVTGVTGYRVYDNAIAGNGFEANAPFDIYADRVANLSIARNDFSRVQVQAAPRPDHFIRLDGPQGAFNVRIEHNQFSSGITTPFTAILGGAGLQSADLDDNRFNLPAGNRPFAFAAATKSTRRTLGDTVLTNQSLAFADRNTGTADVTLSRGGPGILSVSAGVVGAMQTVRSSNGALVIDCANGLTALHTLTSNTRILAPLNPVPGAVLNLVVFQGQSNYAIEFAPIFKRAGAFTAKPVHFSTIRFVYTGLYWVQLGAAALDAPL